MAQLLHAREPAPYDAQNVCAECAEQSDSSSYAQSADRRPKPRSAGEGDEDDLERVHGLIANARKPWGSTTADAMQRSSMVRSSYGLVHLHRLREHAALSSSYSMPSD